MSARALAGLALLCAPALVLARQDAERTGPAASTGRGFLALRAGKIHLVEDGRVLEGGTLLLKDGLVQAAGTGIDVPADAEIVDYGPDAVIVPGLVAAYSSYALGWPSERTADAGLSALDGFDPYRVYADALAGGVTTAYLTPAENRLIAGTGAMVKLGGEREEGRVLAPLAAIHGAIDRSARNTPGYWDPPVPVAVDVELGFARPQLPKTTMGAIVALGELLDGAADPDDERFQEEYGRRAGTGLARALATKAPLRIAAGEETEIRALLAFAAQRNVPLILDRAHGARELAAEIAAAGVSVVYRLPYVPNGPAVDRGKAEDDRWPTFDAPAALVAAGARVAITGSSPRELLFAARLASRGGLDPAAALRAITLSPAEMLGVAGRVGSLRAGKDADVTVLNGDPLAAGTSVLATWIEGRVVWTAHAEERSTVIEVHELHVGDGHVLRPGELLMRGRRIVEVGARVSRPRGATVVRGRACMPGMIDALGHLGLEGSRKVPATDFELARLVEPGDAVDRKVALQGITTVVLSPRGTSDSGAPLMAYKPAATELEGQVVGDPVALRLRWEDANRMKSGQTVRALLVKAKEYREKWLEYERAMAAWTPPSEAPADAAAPADEKKEGAEKKEEAAEGDKPAEKKDEKAAEGDKKPEDEKKEESKSKKKKKKKDEPEVLEPDPITGLWQAEVVHPAGAPAVTLKMRVLLAKAGESAAVEGNLRCDAASSDLVELEGWFDREKKQLDVSGLGSRGWITLAATLQEEKLAGELSITGQEVEVSLERKSKEYPIARRPERASKEEEPVKEPKGRPKEPRLDAKLEPLRRAMEGRGAVVVEANRASDLVSCVDAFQEVGIRPVLYGASEAHLVVDRLVGRVAGLLLEPLVVDDDPERGTDYRTPYGDLQGAGIPLAFLSEAEEGAIDLPLRAVFAVANGMSPEGALRALTADAAAMLEIDGRVGRLAAGLDADVLLLDGPPLDPGTSVLRVWVNGDEVEAP